MSTLISQELDYLFRQFGDPTLGFYYVDYKDAIIDETYGEITGGKTYLVKQCDLLGILKTDPLEIQVISEEHGIKELQEGALFKVSTGSLFKSGVLDENGNFAIYDDPSTTIVEGILNKKFIRFKGEFYQILAAQKALIYQGEVSSIYFLTTKKIDTTNLYGDSELVVVDGGDIPVPPEPEDRGQQTTIKMANPSESGWTDIQNITIKTPDPLDGVVRYFFVDSLSLIPNLTTDTAFVIGSNVYNMTSTQEMQDGIKDFKVLISVNEGIQPEDIPDKEGSEFDDITEGETVYFYHRKELWSDQYSEGRWVYKYESTLPADKVSTSVTVGISSIPPEFASDDKVKVNLYSDNPDLFKVRSEEPLDETNKYVLIDAVAVKGVGYYVSNKVDIGQGKYRYELKTTSTFTFDDIPVPVEYGNITIKKTVKGIKTLEELKDYVAVINYGDSDNVEFNFVHFIDNGDTTFTATQTVKVKTGSYTVSESNVPALAGYDIDQDASTLSTSVVVNKDGTAIAEIVNAYKESEGGFSGELEGLTVVTVKRRRMEYLYTSNTFYVSSRGTITEEQWGKSIEPPKPEYVTGSKLSSISYYNGKLEWSDVKFNLYNESNTSIKLPTNSGTPKKLAIDVIQYNGELYASYSAAEDVVSGAVEPYLYRFEMRILPPVLKELTTFDT